MAAVIPMITAAAPYLAAGSQVLSAFQSISAGKQQSSMYKLQAQQVRLKASRDALQYEQQANQVFERMLMNNATAAARGFSGGVQGFTGSAGLIQRRNEKVAGRDIGLLESGARESLSFGEIQAGMLKDAASQAVQGSYFDAISKLGTAAYMYNATNVGSVSSTTAGNVSSGINLTKPVSSSYGVQL